MLNHFVRDIYLRNLFDIYGKTNLTTDKAVLVNCML